MDNYKLELILKWLKYNGLRATPKRIAQKDKIFDVETLERMLKERNYL
jgi:hypothetical protein